MKKALKIIAIVGIVALVIIQFIQPDFTNPQIVEADTLEASMQIPSPVETILTRSCGDCHSNKTVYPWYAKIAPVSWWLANHIAEGRRHLNFSTWNTYDAKRRGSKFKEICEQVESGEMPLPSYLWAHSNAVLKEGEAKTLCDWANAARTAISEEPVPNK
jgi:hypothetical protein